MALLGGLMALQGEHDSEKIFDKALQVVRQVQGMGSGADILASLKGGVNLFRSIPSFYHRSLSVTAKIFGVYSGSKTPTCEVVQHVAQIFSAYPQLLQEIDNLNDVLTLTGVSCLDSSEDLGKLFNRSAGLMEVLGVCNQELVQFLWELRHVSYGVKLSGSGLGDCAIGVVKDGVYPKNSFPVHVSAQGLKAEPQ